ncbi:MAG: hypothetical protein FJW96_09915, partial [Actinobacteria bacterium]|nr:hypothetical protein [Actinomycetota bacterium]
MAAASRPFTDGELASPAPLWEALPGLYREPDLPAAYRVGDREESFLQRFTTALDAVLSPVFHTLDNLPAYFDPKYAPEDFLDWIAGWVGLELNEKWESELRRKLVAEAVHLHQGRGTRRGVERIAEILAEVEPGKVTIEESGGVWACTTHKGRFPEFPNRPATTGGMATEGPG